MMLERVRQIIADALYVDLEEVSAEANLMNDLGAESIDFLDICFRLEKEFSIKIPRGAIEAQVRGSLSDEEFAVEGRLTAKALSRLQQVMPELEPSQVASGFFVRDIPGLFTTMTFVRMVKEQLGQTEGHTSPRTNSSEQPSAIL